ncbi:MAG TPA: RNA polymerase sigma factor [Usitatibacter sp.]|nr:RNA polymerase sigma factor [Usitatibacter sp.]
MTATAATPSTARIDPRISDTDLARLVGEGNEAAIRLLTKRHNQTLFRTARAILREDAEAEDAVQEAYIKAIRAISSFRSDAKLSTWLTRITVNEALAKLRRSRRAAEVIPLAADLPAGEHVYETTESTTPTPEDDAMRAQTRKIVEARIDALPDAFRAVFVLRAVEEMSVEETATVLGIPEPTVRTRFFRARGLLRESLSRDMDVALDQAFHFAGERCDRITEGVIARLRTEAWLPK